MRNRFGRRQRKMIEDLPLTPLIDTALTLLVIFMVSSPMLHNAIKVSLPNGKAKEVKAHDQNNVTVYIDKDQQLYVHEKRIELAELLDHLNAEQLAQHDGTVFVQADQLVHYGKVIEVVDKLKVAGGVRHVALATKNYA